MKKDKLIKLIKGSVKDAYYEMNTPKSDCVVIKSNDFNYTETDEESKQKIRNLILRLCKKREEFDINISDFTISIYAKEVINSKRQIYFNIDIMKDVGYNINCNNRRVLMKDTSLYDEMVVSIKEIFDSSNIENFNELYNIIMKDNGLNRETNLDELLSGY